jgi:RND family efflux transporter MFP subunit
MRNALAQIRRFARTAVAAAAAFMVATQLWAYYMNAPWTRDGHVRADIVQVAPDVSGFVTDVLVHDNQEFHNGDVLFRIDRARFALALQQADAVVENRHASLDQATKDLARYRGLATGTVVTEQKQEQVLAVQLEAKAAYDQEVADRAVAQLNLDRSDVRASVSGTITNMDLRPGVYVTSGKGVMALVDADTLRVEGYFEETKLPRIHVGDGVEIHLMGDSEALRGHVESIAAGIEDRDRTNGASLLANVNPTFNWVRLAQRVPVRIVLDHVPEHTALVVGRSATVDVSEPEKGRLSQAGLEGITGIFSPILSAARISQSWLSRM